MHHIEPWPFKPLPIVPTKIALMTQALTPPVHPQSSLRERANTLLQAQSTGLSIGKDASMALRVLFDLAATPETAHDALALLHELQVHQVELDLQNEELQSSRVDLEAACERQMQLHDASPGAQLVLNAKGVVLECNAQTLAQLRQTKPNVCGKPLSAWLVATDVPRLQAWLNQALGQKEASSLALMLRLPGGIDCPVIAAARANPLDNGILLTWVPAPADLS
jgi:PAS domain-containing protein